MDDRRLGSGAKDRQSACDRSVFINNAVIVVLFRDALIFAGLAQQPSVARTLVAVGAERIVLKDCTAFGHVVSKVINTLIT